MLTSLDRRLADIKQVLNWFDAWQLSIQENVDLTKRMKYRSLMSRESREDLASAIVGFQRLVDMHLRKFPSNSLVPARYNTDICENFFCQQRAVKNGASTNPNYYQYRYTINTILLSTGLVKKSGNAGGNNTVAQPFSVALSKKLTSRKRKQDNVEP